MVNAKKRKGALLTAMIVLVAALLLLGTFQNHRVKALTNQVNAAYEKSLYEAVALMNGIQLNLEKLLVSSSGNGHEEQLLATITQQSEGAQSNLAGVPLSPELLTGAMKFVNQMGDYGKALGKQIADGGKLGEKDIQQLISMHDACVELNLGLFDILGQYERGELGFDVPDNLQVAAKDISTQTEPMVDYPVLLYDGPFSDADRTSAALSGDPVDQATAQQMLIDFVGADRVKKASFTGESTIMDKCFEFELDTTDGLLTCGVTQRGGHVLYILPEQGVENASLTQGECIDRALQFLGSRSYSELEVSYWRQLGGLLTVNFAASQDSVLLYPDLIKVQVSMQSGMVVGLDASSYLKNHRKRYLAEPQFTSVMALDSLGAVLTPDRIRRCVIPLDSGGEAQCWEITAHMEGGNQYLVYKDVITGEELQILRIMVEDDGVLAQ